MLVWSDARQNGCRRVAIVKGERPADSVAECTRHWHTLPDNQCRFSSGMGKFDDIILLVDNTGSDIIC